jgi:CO/xanthine dehydrogenase Mo-binding subunit
MRPGGTIGSLAALANAVSDAIGAEVFHLPLTPEHVRTLRPKAGMG